MIGNERDLNLLNFGPFETGNDDVFVTDDGICDLLVKEFFLNFFFVETFGSCNLDLFGSGLFEKNTFLNCSSRKTCSWFSFV